MDDMHAALGQFRRQRPHRQVGLLSQPRQKPVPDFARQDRTAMPADLAEHLPASRPLPLADPNRRSDRYPEPLRRAPNRRTILQSRSNSNPEINRKWQHHEHPHHRVVPVNHGSTTKGIP